MGWITPRIVIQRLATFKRFLGVQAYPQPSSSPKSTNEHTEGLSAPNERHDMQQDGGQHWHQFPPQHANQDYSTQQQYGGHAQVPHAAHQQLQPGVNVFNPGAYKQQQQAQQQQQEPQQQQEQFRRAPYGGGPPSSFGQGHQPNMDFGLNAITAAANSQAFSMGVGMGQEYLNASVSRYTPWVTSVWHGLKYYFAVNHHYVKRKLFTLVFPYRKRHWRRQMKDSGAAGSSGAYGQQGGNADSASAMYRPQYQVPMLDENAPDLYIPLMAFVTYVLVTGYAKGTKNSFTPEVLVEVTSSCLVMQLLEIAVIRLGLYLLQAPATLLDLLAVTGYKYVALNFNMVLGLNLGPRVYLAAMVYTGLAMAYFSLKTFAQAVRLAGPRDLASAPVRVELMVLGFALMQFFSVWWLGYSGDLKASG